MKTPALLPHWLTLATLAAFTIAMCATMGCASIPDDWKLTRDASAKPWFYVTVDDPDTICRFLGSQASLTTKVDGCAIWKAQGGEIYLPPNPPRWLVEHEERHLMGWTHE